MRIHFLPSTLAATALLFFACTQTELTDAPSRLDRTETSGSAVGFTTYMSGGAATRAGSAGSIDTDKLKTSGYGFGVFAYYTGTADYAQGTAPNFMYNQEVAWTTGAAYEGYVGSEGTGADAGYWKYEPLKYWPNEINQGAATNTPDDDQDDDQSNNQATGSGTYGGNVSFFAYAPYVDLPITAGSALDGTTSGVVAINEATNLAGASTPAPGTGNQKAGNPTLTYIVPAEGNKVVDLLWGTASNTSTGVTGAANAGVTGVTDTSGGTYAEAILDGYTVNANLTKQKTTGTVGFAFKHALSKVGGSQEYTSSSITVPHGLMIILDVDNLMGAESGGELEEIQSTDADYATLYDATNTEYRTKVTVTDISVVARSLVKDDSDNEPTDAGYTTTYLAQNTGVFDLATGQWNVTGTTTTSQASAATTTHHITSSESSLTPASGTLAASIAEVDLGSDANTLAGFKSLPLGVTTTRQNVYANETYPLVFIPGTWPELTVSICYTVRTYDANLSNKYSEVTQKITKKVTFDKAVELNKQYNLLMHLGLTSVKFTATVSDWERWVTAEDESGVPTTEEAIEHVFIPRNVGEIVDKGTETTTITIGGINYIVVLSQEGVEDGQTYFDTRKPITITVYKNSIADTNKVTLGEGQGEGGTANTIYFLCGGSGTHFHRGGEITYNTTEKTATMTTDPADYDIIHAPITVYLTINGVKQSAATVVYIWPTNYLPY